MQLAAFDEVFENQRSHTLHGWTATSGNRGPPPFSRRTGKEGFESLSEVPLPPGWTSATQFEIDFNYTTCDANGWTYARDFEYFTDDFLGQNKPSTMFRARRRRYVRYPIARPVEEESKQAVSNEFEDIAYGIDVKVNARTISTQGKRHYTMKMLRDGIRLLLKGEEQITLTIGNFSYHYDGASYDLQMTQTVEDALRLVQRVSGTDPYFDHNFRLVLVANSVTVTVPAPPGSIPVEFEMVNEQVTVLKVKKSNHPISASQLVVPGMVLVRLDDTDVQPLGISGVKNYLSSKKDQQRLLTFGELSYDSGASNILTANGTSKRPMPYKLHVDVLRAKGLLAADVMTSDPYACVRVAGELIGKTAVIGSTLNPVWNETFTSPLLHPYVQLKIELFDEDDLRPDDPLGYVEFEVSQLLRAPVQGWYPVKAGKGQLELKMRLETQNVLRVQPSALESPSMRVTEPILYDARQLIVTYRVPQSCVDFLEHSAVVTQPKDLTVLRDLLCDVQSVCEPSQPRAAENVAAAFVMYPFDTPHISRVLTTDMLTNRTQARLAMEDEIKAVEEEAESFVSNLKSGMFSDVKTTLKSVGKAALAGAAIVGMGAVMVGLPVLAAAVGGAMIVSTATTALSLTGSAAVSNTFVITTASETYEFVCPNEKVYWEWIRAFRLLFENTDPIVPEFRLVGKLRKKRAKGVIRAGGFEYNDRFCELDGRRMRFSYGESEAELRTVIPLRDIVSISLSNDRADPKDFLVEVHIISATLPSNVAPSATVYLELKARSVQEKTPVLKANSPFWNLNVKIPVSQADVRGGGFTLYMYTSPANSSEYVLAGERFVTYNDLFSEPNFSQEPIPHEITLTSERRHLEVTIVNVKGIVGTGASGNCDVYCKVAGVLRKNGKLAERKSTSVKYKTVSPVFNERIVLGESMAVDDYSAVLVEVWDKHKMVNADSLLGTVSIPLDDFGTRKTQRVYELKPPPEAEAATNNSDPGFLTVATELTIIDLADPEARQRHSQLAVDLPPDGNFGSVSLRIRSTACNEFSTWWPGQTLDEVTPEYFYACAGYDYLVLKEHEQRRQKTSNELEAFCVQMSAEEARIELFENERFRPLKGWGSEGFLLPTDRPRFTDESGDLSPPATESLTDVPCLPGYVWHGDWTLDLTYTNCDLEGWSYGIDFWQLNSDLEKNSSKATDDNAFTRRRKWVRTMRRTGVSPTASALSAASPAPAAELPRGLVPFLLFSDGKPSRVQVYENERKVPFNGWSVDNLLPTDPERFTDDRGKHHVPSLDAIPLPPGYEWGSDWTLYVEAPSTDTEGWSYGIDFWKLVRNHERGGSHGKPSMYHCTRRRLWQRTLVKLKKSKPRSAGSISMTSPTASDSSASSESKARAADNFPVLLRGCREYSAEGKASYIPWEQVKAIQVVTPSTLWLTIEVGRNVSSGREEPVYRDADVNVLIGPCSATRLGSLMFERQMLRRYRGQVRQSLQDASLSHRDRSLIPVAVQEATNALQVLLMAADSCGHIISRYEAHQDDPATAAEIQLLQYRLLRLQLYVRTLLSMNIDSPLVDTKTAAAAAQEDINAVLAAVAQEFQSAPDATGSVHVTIAQINSLITALQRAVAECVLCGFSKRDTIAQALEEIINRFYIQIVSSISRFANSTVSLSQVSGQDSKMKLIEFFIVEDETMDSLVHPLLHLYRLQMSYPLYISTLVNFRGLLGFYGTLLQAEMKSWVDRTVQSYQRRERSGHFPAAFPWDIDNIEGKFCSTLPVDVVTALQTYVQDVTQESLQAALSEVGRERIKLYHQQVASGVAAALVNLCNEHYRRAIDTLVARTTDPHVPAQEKAEYPAFFCACINDCRQFSTRYADHYERKGMSEKDTNLLRTQFDRMALYAVKGYVAFIADDVGPRLNPAEWKRTWFSERGTQSPVIHVCQVFAEYFTELRGFVDAYYFDKAVSLTVDLFTKRYFEFLRELCFSNRHLTAQDVQQILEDEQTFSNCILSATSGPAANKLKHMRAMAALIGRPVQRHDAYLWELLQDLLSAYESNERPVKIFITTCLQLRAEPVPPEHPLWHFCNVNLAVQASPDAVDEEDIYEQLFKQTKEEYRKAREAIKMPRLPTGFGRSAGKASPAHRASRSASSATSERLPDGDSHELVVTVVRADRLAPSELLGKRDPYAVVQLNGVSYRTATVRGTREPQWNETFRFNLASAVGATLHCQVFNQNMLRGDTPLGEAAISLAGLDVSDKDEWFPLHIAGAAAGGARIHLRLHLRQNVAEAEQS